MVELQDRYLLTKLLLKSWKDGIMEQISNEQTLKEIVEEMIELGAKIAEWNSNTDNTQTIEE